MTAVAHALWVVGAGKMAGAMLDGWRRAGVLGNAIIAIRPSGRPVEGATVVTDIPVAGDPPLVLIGVKPQKLDDIVKALEPRVGPGTVLLSILAGVELASLRARFPRAALVIRLMPNLPVSEGQGVIAVIGERSIDPGLLDFLGVLGTVVAVRDEIELAAVGSLAGAGPAYVARFVAALAKAGVERGLAPEIADRIALETVLGTAAMASASGETMESVAVRVASPNGTTEAGLKVLDQQLHLLISRTLEAASRRGQELAAAARIDGRIDSGPPLA